LKWITCGRGFNSRRLHHIMSSEIQSRPSDGFFLL
jgi:hypothetical protein